MKNETGIEDILDREGVYVCTVSGTSMYPMLRDRRDTVAIRKYTGRLRRHDVPLYKRDGEYVLHRIVKVLPDGYHIRGDNCTLLEKNIPEGNIIGVLDKFWRDDREISLTSAKYRAYVHFLCIVSPFIRTYRRLTGSFRQKLKKIK